MTRCGGTIEWGTSLCTSFEYARTDIAWEDILANIPFSARCPRIDVEPKDAEEYVGNCFTLMSFMSRRPIRENIST